MRNLLISGLSLIIIEIMVKKLIYVHHYGEIIDVIFISSYLTKLLTLSK